jgi:hypothetical protein
MGRAIHKVKVDFAWKIWLLFLLWQAIYDSQMMLRKIQAMNINEIVDPTFTVCADFNPLSASALPLTSKII